MAPISEEIDRLVSAWHEQRRRARRGVVDSERSRIELERELARRRAAIAAASSEAERTEQAQRLMELLLQSSSLLAATPSDRGADEQVSALMLEGGEAAWSVLVELIGRAQDDGELAEVGVGPVEDLFRDHAADRFLERVEERLRADRRFRVAFAAAWGLPASLRDLSRRHRPGPDPAHPVSFSAALLDRYVRFLQAARTTPSDWPASSDRREGALRAAGLSPDEASAVAALVHDVAMAVRAPEASARAAASLAEAPVERKRLLAQLTAMLPAAGLEGLPLPDLESAAAREWFASRDAGVRRQIVAELDWSGSQEERLAPIRAAWGDQAVDLVVWRLEELAGPIGRGWPA